MHDFNHDGTFTLVDGDLDSMDIEERIRRAVLAVKKGRCSTSKASLWYCVPRQTLRRRIEGGKSRTAGHEYQMALTISQENMLVEWLKVVGTRGIPMTIRTLRDYAGMIAGHDVGESLITFVLFAFIFMMFYSSGETWPRRFRERHPNIKIRWTAQLERCRAIALNETVVTHHFNLLEEVVNKYEIKPQNMYNMDEKGVQLGVARREAVLVDRDQKDVYAIQNGNRELITIIECICADGIALRPTVIFQGQRRDHRWGQNNPAKAR